MAVFGSQFIWPSNYFLMKHAPINELKLFKITVFVVNKLFSVQLKQENTKYSCFPAGP